MAVTNPYNPDTTSAAQKVASAVKKISSIMGQGTAQPTTPEAAEPVTAQQNTAAQPVMQPSYGGAQYDKNTDYQAAINSAVAAKDYAAAAQYEKLRNAKIQGEGLNFEQTNQYASYLPESKKNYGGVDYNTEVDYMAKIQDAVKRGDYAAAAQYEKQRNAKIQGEGLQNFETTNLYSKYVPTTPEAAGVSDPAKIMSQMTELLNQWKEAASQQQTGQIDYATQQAVTELERALADAAPQYQTQRNQIASDERKAMDNAALYAEVRGDRGGIGQEQYNLIQSSAAQSRLAVSQAQTKLSTDTARQIADLRAKGEFEKADALLTLTQTYLSQLMSLQQWQINYAMDYAQFQEALRQWQVEYEQNMAQLTGRLPGGELTLSAKQQETSQLASIGKALLSAGVLPNDAQLAAMGMTKAQAQDYLTVQGLASAASSGTGSGSGAGAGPGSSSGYDNGSQSAETIKALQTALGVTADGKWGPATQAAAQKKWGTTSADEAAKKSGVQGNKDDNDKPASQGKYQSQYSGTDKNSKTSLTSLNIYPDEGVITWNGKTYSSVDAWMRDVKANTNLTAAQAETLRAKYKAQTGVSLTDYGY